MLVVTKEFVIDLLKKELDYAMDVNASPQFVLGLQQAILVIENERPSA